MSDEVVDNAAPVEDKAVPAEVAPVEEAKEYKFSDFLSGASDEVKESAEWEKFKEGDAETFLKSHLELSKLVGKRGDIPQDTDAPEVWAEYYAKTGVPKDATGYEFAFDDETKSALGDEAESLTAYVGSMKELALAHNIPAKAFDAFLADAMKHEVGLRSAGAEETEAATNAKMKILEDEWGDQFEVMGQAVQALEKHYDMTPEEMDEIENSPIVNKLLGRIAKDLDEKGQVGNAFSQTQIGIQDEITDVKGQISTVLRDNGGDTTDPRLVSFLARLDRLEEKTA